MIEKLILCEIDIEKFNTTEIVIVVSYLSQILIISLIMEIYIYVFINTINLLY